MNNFKLIGIRPHKNCGEKFLKVLEPGRLYQFYNDYEFFIDRNNVNKFDGVNGDILSFKYNPTVPNDLYKIGDLNINVSAVVGKNGTGKSTLIELLLYCVYYLGTNLENGKGEKVLHQYKDHIGHKIYANNEKISDYKNKKSVVNQYVEKCLLEPQKSAVTGKKKLKEAFIKKQEELLDLGFSIIELENNQISLKNDKNAAQEEHDSIINSLKCSLFYELDEVIYELKIDNEINFNSIYNKLENEENLNKKRDLKIISVLTPKSTELLNSFFYSIVLNYSHHSLNSKHLGYWINTLFHKNDGYKTPAVINPMREHGKFDINHENYLAKTRLLINLLVDCLVNKNKNPLVTDKQRVLKIQFSLNERKEIGETIKIGNKSSKNPKEDFIMSGETTNLLMKIHGLSFEEGDLSIYDSSLPFNQKIHNYISDKSLKIEEQYPEYRVKRKDGDNIFSATDKYVEHLVGDNSHITFKLKQALYFLGKTAKDGESSIWSKKQDYFEFSLDQLLIWMEISNVENLDNIFKRIPPSIFKIDFVLTESIDNPKPSFFENLSSGEQQKIHTINSIIYHLNNLYSVHRSKSVEKRIKYDNLNIILDEIELYYHPDLQRRFIYDLIGTIKCHKHLVKAEYIKGLNFIFSTHSPFILSDIPLQNLLLMGRNDKTLSKQKTFSANIYDLLANAFFMDEGYIGEYAKSKIEDVIKYVHKSDFNKDEHLKYEEIVDLIGDKFIQEKLKDMLKAKKKMQAND